MLRIAYSADRSGWWSRVELALTGMLPSRRPGAAAGGLGQVQVFSGCAAAGPATGWFAATDLAGAVGDGLDAGGVAVASHLVAAVGAADGELPTPAVGVQVG